MCLNTSNIALSDFNQTMMPNTLFREVDFEVQIDYCRGESLSFFNSFALVMLLKEQLNMMLLQESEKVTKTLEVEQALRFSETV